MPGARREPRFLVPSPENHTREPRHPDFASLNRCILPIAASRNLYAEGGCASPKLVSCTEEDTTSCKISSEQGSASLPFQLWKETIFS